MRAFVVACMVLAAACGDNKVVRDDAGVQDDAAALVGCIDESGVSLAPNGQLPCDLVPPGLQP